MREIKFRAWDKEDKIMLYPEDNAGFEFGILYDGTLVIYRIGSKRRLLPLEYTGLKDKNGKAIYEGDIVELKGFWKEEVKFEKIYDGELGGEIGIGYDLRWESGEIIGNIYEHQELLK